MVASSEKIMPAKFQMITFKGFNVVIQPQQILVFWLMKNIAGLNSQSEMTVSQFSFAAFFNSINLCLMAYCDTLDCFL